MTAKLSAPKARLYAFVAFLSFVFLTGGGARDDLQSLVVLRPIAVLFCGYALVTMNRNEWTGRLFPLFAIGALILLMVAQLTPLPPSIWTEMRGREIYAEIADIAGIEQPWRPITLSPSRTANSLFSLAIPVASLLLYLNLDRRHRKSVIPIILVLCLISAMLAVLQLVGSGRGPLYLYQITNVGSGVGLFANRNHQAVMLSAAIVMLGWYAASQRFGEAFASQKFYGSIAAIFVLVPLVFVTGSRAGLLLMAPGLLCAFFFVYFGRFSANRDNRIQSRKGENRWTAFFRRWKLVPISLLVVSIAILSIVSSQSLAFDRLFGDSDLGGLRIAILPTLIAMTGDYWPWGSGFGSFEYVYKIYEPQKLLSPTYLNQAHNDWLQFVIEGGVGAALIALAALCWLFMCMIRLFRSWRSADHKKYQVLMCATVMIIFVAASVGDYPMRVPSVMAVFVILAALLNDGIQAVQVSATKKSVPENRQK